MNYLDNKYSKAYFKIILRSKDRVLLGYHEKHHIIPKALGGSNKKDNLVKLTAHEHFVCHLLLTKCLEGEDRAKMVYATKRMVVKGNKHQTNRYTPSGRIYKMVKKLTAEESSARMKNNNPMSREEVKLKHTGAIIKRGKTSGMSGQSHSLQTKQKMKDSRALQDPMPVESKKRISEWMLSVTSDPSYVNPMYRPGARDNYDLAMSGRSARNQKTCPHCQVTCTANVYARWHGHNCRKKTSNE
jgi:Fe-S oxidoreductase